MSSHGENLIGGERRRPTPSDLEGIDAFLGDFLLPMLADGRIDAEEETPLVVAFHAYGLDAFEPWFVTKHVSDRLQFGIPGYSRNVTRAWARIRPHADRMTRNDFLRTREWLEGEARRAGMPGLTLPDSEPETQFASASIDGACITQFTRLVETLRASRLPIAPAYLQPPIEMEGSEPSVLPAATENETAEVAERADRAAAPEGNGSVPVAEAVEAPPVPVVPSAPPVIDVPVSAALTAELVLQTAERLRNEAEPILEGFLDTFPSDPDTPPGLLFDDARTSVRNQAVILEPSNLDDPSPLWFVGDLHGDLLALEAVLHHVTTASPDAFPRLVFLGDLIDDGNHGYELLLRLMELIALHPGRITILAGNHDEALAYDAEADLFRSSVSPSDFTDWLNGPAGEEPVVRKVAQAAIDFVARLPRALFFPDGLLAAHAGIPLADLRDQLNEPADLDRPECLQDFVWTRAHPRARRKIPNRTTRGCEFGFEDLEQFFTVVGRLLNREDAAGRLNQEDAAGRMIRGHDHVEERYELYPRYERAPLLTINSMSHRLPREVFGPYPRVPCIALYQEGTLPQVHRIRIADDVIGDVYPEQAESHVGQ